MRVLKQLSAPLMAGLLLLCLWSLQVIMDRVSYAPVRGALPSLHLSLAVEPSEVRAGQPVMLEFSIKNKGQKPVVIQFPGANRYQMAAYSNDTRVWSRVHSSTGLGIEAFTLNPGQSRVYREKWNLKNDYGELLPPGSYRIGASFYGEWPGQKGRTQMEPVRLVVR